MPACAPRNLGRARASSAAAPAPAAAWAAVLLVALASAALPAAGAQDADGGGGPSPSDQALVFAVSIAAVVGIALYVSREAIARKRTAYDAGSYESQRDRDYEKYHSEWGDDSAAGRGGGGDVDGGDIGDGGGDSRSADGRAGAPPGAAAADLYGVLGLDASATQDEVKRRYRELAKRLHPDRAGRGGAEEGAAESGTSGGSGGGGGGSSGGSNVGGNGIDAGSAMAAINEAYGVLSDPERRRAYDLTRGRQRRGPGRG